MFNGCSVDVGVTVPIKQQKLELVKGLVGVNIWLNGGWVGW